MLAFVAGLPAYFVYGIFHETLHRSVYIGLQLIATITAIILKNRVVKLITFK